MEENQKNGYIKVEKQMSMFQWNCDMYVPNTLFYGELRRFAMILTAELLMLISVAVIGSWYFSKKTYVPVGNLISDNKKLSKKVKRKEETRECRELEKYLTGAVKNFPYASLNKLSDQEKYIMIQFAFDENGDAVFRDQEKKEKPEELEHFVLENILKEQIFEKYPGILLQPEKDFVAVVNLSEPEHDEKEIRSLLKTVEQFYSRTFHISACIMIGECQSDYKKMKEAYHLLEESMQYLEFWSTSAPAGVYVYGEMMDADEDSHSSVYMTGSRRLLNCLESEDFEGAYRELNQIYQSAFSRNQKELRINRYRMYGLIAAKIFDVQPVNAAYHPQKKGTFGMYLSGQWYHLTAKADLTKDDPVEGLDVAYLQREFLQPYLDIQDPKTSKRIRYVGGIRGLSELERMVDHVKETQQKDAVAFSMYPTSMAELFAVADAGMLMPPKSTWFEPKLRSGLFLHML